MASDEGSIAGEWEAEQFRDVYLPTRLHQISGWPLPTLAWSAESRFLNCQSRVRMLGCDRISGDIVDIQLVAVRHQWVG